ncbi:MAG: hypothetical protein KBE09_01390 [Candidatus Pacebacteria bacterium]|nr:hypothetical protein [Candidatus Paceibacterota bacterium]
MNALDEITKHRLVFLDTETTGREAHDRIFQVAYEHEGKEVCEMFKPPVPLCIEAMEATGYTNKDVADKKPFPGSVTHTNLAVLLPQVDVVMVAHNAPFDIDMLKRDGVEARVVIDTLKVARHLDPEGKLGAYRLQYLRYALDLEVADAAAHDALGDVRVLKALFARLYDKLRKEHADAAATIAAMVAISQAPSFITRITFGKHAGKLLVDLAKEDRSYLQWLLKQKEADTEDSHDQNADWIYTLKRVLG